MSSPTARSLELLRKLGYVAAVVERFNAHVPPHGIRIDLFGLADIEAITQDHTLYVQATPAARLSDHLAKCLSVEHLPVLIATPARRFEIWSWGKRRRGGRDRWVLRRLRARSVGNGDRMPDVAFVELEEDVSPETPMSAR